jgi:uncharacterized protein (DUF486 family)
LGIENTNENPPRNDAANVRRGSRRALRRDAVASRALRCLFTISACAQAREPARGGAVVVGARRAVDSRTSTPPDMPVVAKTAALLVLSNLFMTFAWYAHLKNLSTRPWYVAALASWGIALFEYLLQVPANRIGYTALSLGQLKILQEAITIGVFVPFAVLYMKQPIKLDFLWAALCLMGAVYFIFRGGSPA